MSRRVAIITGISGQDGSYLAEFLLKKGYRIFGLFRRNSQHGFGNADHLTKCKDVEFYEGDLSDLTSLLRLCKIARADEFYNLASQSHVGTSFDVPYNTFEVTGGGVLNCLEAIRHSGIHTRFYQASTSELWGGCLSGDGDLMINESEPFHPRSPYACAKLYGHWQAINYREAYRMYISCGLLFNHESSRRGPNFVTRKITLGVAAIKSGDSKKLYLGNLDAKRDWGYAPDYVAGMWQMLQLPHPEDFILATGESHSVREFCELAFKAADLGDYKKYVEIDNSLLRPADVHTLLGDSRKAKAAFNWAPTVVFDELVKKMVASDIADVI